MFEKNDFTYLILNAQGARVLKEVYGDKATRIFIYVDRDIIIERQKAAGANDVTINEHFVHYDEDMAYKEECRYAYENTDLAHTVFKVSEVLDKYMNRNLVEKD